MDLEKEKANRSIEAISRVERILSVGACIDPKLIFLNFSKGAT